MTRAPAGIRSLRPHEWPAIDQRNWVAACRPGGRLTRGGSASHLKPVTREDLERRYGLFLDFLARSGLLAGDASSKVLITPQNVVAYLDEITRRVSSVTVHGAIAKLRRMGTLLDPDWDEAWLREIEQDLAWQMRPAPKFDRIVDSDRLAEVGIQLMERAEAGTHLPPRRRAELFRNGLMIALLATCPIRLKNFAALAIGQTLRRVHDCWLITLPAASTKTNRADERSIDGYLATKIDAYLAEYRLPKEATEAALWIGRNGKSLSYDGVERIITETCRRSLGISVSPHMFRSCGASTAYLGASDSPGLAAALLQHTDPRVTERYYNRARSVKFAGEFMRIVEGDQSEALGFGS